MAVIINGNATPAAGSVAVGDGTTLQFTAAGTAGQVLTSNGASPPSFAALPAAGVTSFAGGSSGLTPASATTGAVTLGGTLAVANGGTGQTTVQAAMNAFAGAVTSGSYLRGNGTNVVMNTIQVADVPTLNQNTTGTAANVTGTVAVANGGTGQTTYTNGQLLIGNSTGNTLTKATLTAGCGITITNSTGSITIASSGGGGVCCATPTVAGKVYGKTTNACFGTGRTSLGYNANPSYTGIAIGNNANDTAFLGQNILIGNNTASNMMACSAIVIGSNAQVSTGNLGAIAIGVGVNATAGGLFISPVRNITGTTYLGYCATSKEITYSAGAPSDINLKENIQPIGCALNKTAQIRGVTFDWKSCGKNAIGVIAQEVESVFPQLVTLEGDGYKTVKYDNMVAVLIEAVKELKTRVETLEFNS